MRAHRSPIAPIKTVCPIAQQENFVCAQSAASNPSPRDPHVKALRNGGTVIEYDEIGVIHRSHRQGDESDYSACAGHQSVCCNRHVTMLTASSRLSCRFAPCAARHADWMYLPQLAAGLKPAERRRFSNQISSRVGGWGPATRIEAERPRPRERAWGARTATESLAPAKPAGAQIHAQNKAQSWKLSRTLRELRKQAREPRVGGWERLPATRTTSSAAAARAATTTTTSITG